MQVVQHTTMLWKWPEKTTQVFILDIDGTLLPTAEIDDQCYWQAVFECFGTHHKVPDLHGFKHVTDNGILSEWTRRELGREATETETTSIRYRFHELLARSSEKYFQPVAGVEAWLQEVVNCPTVFAGIATGGWSHSAKLKLQLSGLDRFELPLANSDDAVARRDIMQKSADRVHTRHGIETTNITYVGDGVWDFLASQALGWSFIGIASGSGKDRLIKAGASHVQSDFLRTPTGISKSVE